MALNYHRIMAHDPGEIAVRYSRNDSILYALGIGIGMDPTDAEQLAYVYEKDLQAFPTMASVLGWMGRLTDPAFGIDPRMVVASDLQVELHRPLPPEGQLVSRPRVTEVVDKGAGHAAIIQFQRELDDPDGTRFATVNNSTLVRNHGGFGGPVTTLPEPPTPPNRAPDAVCDLPTPPNLALLFRLNGDTNPLHVDPRVATAAGFPRPLLHGAATFGIAAHALMRTVAGYRTERFASMQARFAKPVFPGDTLRTEIWKDGNEFSFHCRTVERGDVVLSNGRLRLHSLPESQAT